MKKDEATVLYESIVERLEFIKAKDIGGVAFSIAFETGSRAIDAYFIAVAKIGFSHLISNDKTQVESARKFGVETYYLLEEFENVKEMMKCGIIS